MQHAYFLRKQGKTTGALRRNFFNLAGDELSVAVLSYRVAILLQSNLCAKRLGAA